MGVDNFLLFIPERIRHAEQNGLPQGKQYGNTECAKRRHAPLKQCEQCEQCEKVPNGKNHESDKR